MSRASLVLDQVNQSGEEPLFIVGGGGLGVMVMDTLLAADPGCKSRMIFVDDAASQAEPDRHGVPVVGPTADVVAAITAMAPHPVEAILAVAGYTGRSHLAAQFDSLINLNWVSAIHPAAVVSPLAKVGVGVVILPCAVVDPEAQVGDHAIINKGATVGHNCSLERFAQLGPGTTSGGIIGEGAFIGMSACVLPGVRIGKGATVGAGAVAVSDIPAGAVAVGAPARVR